MSGIIYDQAREDARRKIMIAMAAPLFAAFISFVFTLLLSRFGAGIQDTSLIYKIGAFAYFFMMTAVIWAPSATLALAWFWWRTKEPETNLKTVLYQLPLLMSLTIWCPTLPLSKQSFGTMLGMYFTLVILTLLLGYTASFVLRLHAFGTDDLRFKFWRPQ